MDIPVNQQYIIRTESSIRYDLGLIDKNQHVKNIIKALKCTIPYEKIVYNDNLFITQEECMFVNSLISSRSNYVDCKKTESSRNPWNWWRANCDSMTRSTASHVDSYRMCRWARAYRNPRFWTFPYLARHARLSWRSVDLPERFRHHESKREPWVKSRKPSAASPTSTTAHR